MLLQRQQHMRNGQIASTLASAGVSPGTTSGQLPKGPTPAELQQILSGEIPPNYSPQMAEFIKEQYRQRFIQHKHAALGLANGVMNGAGPSGLSGAAHPSPLSPGVPMANAVPMSPGHLGTAGMGMPNGMNGMLSSPANAIRLLQYQQLQMQAQAAAAAAAASSNPSGGGASVVNLSPSPAPPTVPMSPTTNSSSPAATPPVYIQHMLMNKGVVLNGGNGSSPLQTSSSTQPPSLSQSQLLQQQQPIRAGPGKIALDGTGPSADVIDATSAINGNLARGIS
ncbi:hypothetical protein DFJ73DRAFT_215797 [Zopfochytrium polystomum]|nr:hypothetical protein DFJ73DRAFT_215797 [Zopfochytrium polystomum]